MCALFHGCSTSCCFKTLVVGSKCALAYAFVCNAGLGLAMCLCSTPRGQVHDALARPLARLRALSGLPLPLPHPPKNPLAILPITMLTLMLAVALLALLFCLALLVKLALVIIAIVVLDVLNSAPS